MHEGFRWKIQHASRNLVKNYWSSFLPVSSLFSLFLHNFHQKSILVSCLQTLSKTAAFTKMSPTHIGLQDDWRRTTWTCSVSYLGHPFGGFPNTHSGDEKRLILYMLTCAIYQQCNIIHRTTHAIKSRNRLSNVNKFAMHIRITGSH